MTLGAPLQTSRIEIYGQHGPCDNTDATVARAKPAILEDRLSNSQWNKFCDDLDEALKPATKMRKVMFGGMIALFITLVAIGISFITITNGSQFRRLFPVIGAATMSAGFGTLMCVAVKSKNSISTGLRNVCDETSARHPGVSFHVRYESDGLWSSPCIEVNVAVADATNNNVEVPTGTATIAHAIPVPSPTNTKTETKTNYDPQTVLAFGSGEEKIPSGGRADERA